MGHSIIKIEMDKGFANMVGETTPCKTPWRKILPPPYLRGKGDNKRRLGGTNQGAKLRRKMRGQ